ncbi:hypothetical protein GIB67_003267 [Kingdonia uniflora]|uniref:Uncharacterized protein n=1 Tax=Kingdonia uniflora TaxID=39325 RepID=A0A7J7LXN5_9MAGN|nr:hypothetical protein GIB67_003267 [Kingdonia uniflora]
MHIFENVDGDQFYYQGLLEYIMSDVVRINEAISPGYGIVVKTMCACEIVDVCDDTSLYKMWHCSDVDSMWDVHFYVYALPIEVVPPPLIQQPDVVMIELDEGLPICHTSQVEVEVESTQFDLLHETEVHHTILPVYNPGLEMVIGIEWPTVNAYNAFLRVNLDGITFSIRNNSNLNHTCPGGSGQSNENVNAQWVAKEVEETIRTVKTTRPTDQNVKKLEPTSWRFSFRHMYKNMKKFHRETQIEWLVWSAAKAFKQFEKNKRMNQLKLENSSAHDWLLKKPFEHWAKPHFDFTTKRLKAKEWEEAGLVLVPRAQTYIDKMIKCYGQYQPTNQENHFLPPSLVRGAGRPRKQKIPYPDEEKMQKGCEKYGGYGRNKKTCKGTPATPRPRVARAPTKVDTSASIKRHMSSLGLPPAVPNMRGRGSGGIGDSGRRSSSGARYSHSHTGLKCAESTHSGLTGLKCAKGMGKF